MNLRRNLKFHQFSEISERRDFCNIKSHESHESHEKSREKRKNAKNAQKSGVILGEISKTLHRSSLRNAIFDGDRKTWDLGDLLSPI